MSWDVFAQDLPAEAKRISDIPHDFKPKPIGMRAEIVARMRKVVPGAKFASDWSRADIQGPGFSIDLNIGSGEQCMGLAFFVRGVNPEVVGVIADILDELNLRALQTGPGEEFFDRHGSLKIFESWCRYGHQVVNRTGKPNEKPF